MSVHRRNILCFRQLLQNIECKMLKGNFSKNRGRLGDIPVRIEAHISQSTEPFFFQPNLSEFMHNYFGSC